MRLPITSHIHAGSRDTPVTEEIFNGVVEQRRSTIEDPFDKEDDINDHLLTRDLEYQMSALRDTHLQAIWAMLRQHVVQYQNQVQGQADQLMGVPVDPERLTLQRDHLHQIADLLDSQKNHMQQLRLVQASEVNNLTQRLIKSGKP